MIPFKDNIPTLRLPIVTLVLIALNVIAFVWQLSYPTDPKLEKAGFGAIDQSALEMGAIPYRILNPGEDPRCVVGAVDGAGAAGVVCSGTAEYRNAFQRAEGNPGLTPIPIDMFIHGGWLHILGNMLFLWVFGDNIEDRFGHLRYLLFYLAGGIAASFVQVFLEPDSLVPVIGASGAVAAVLGAYIVLYARATVQVIIPVFIFFPLALPAWVMIGLWFGQNLLAGYFTITSATSADAGVAWFAHIGGFIFGMAVAFVAFTQRGSANRPLPPPDWD